MSSFIGHALIGFAIGSRVKKPSKPQSISIALLYSALAISPDLDYLLAWFAGYHIEPRYTHSIGFCVFIGCSALLIKKVFLKTILHNVAWVLFFITPLSHLVLDYLVGVYASPLLWPFSDKNFTFAYGVLPSAGRIDIGNYYFWRNLLIELGILIPVSIAIVPAYRILLFRKKILFVSVATLLLVFVTIGLSLQR